MHKVLAGVTLVLVAAASSATTWALQSPDHGPVPTVTVSRTDTLPQRLTLADAGSWTPTATLDTSQVTTPSMWQTTPFDDVVEALDYMGIDTALVTTWQELGYVPTDPMEGPDGQAHDDCYILVGDTSDVVCLDGFEEES